MIQVQCGMSANVDIKDILGASETCSSDSNMFVMAASAGDDALGMQLGTGTTAPDNTDYVMETKIAHGNAATQLQYGSQGEVAAAEVGANIDFQIIRSFTNASGGTIQVTEAGVYNFILSGKYALTIHDTFTAVPVLNTETITATYTLRTTV